MLLCDVTLPTPDANIALDEALLDAAEAGELPEGEVLRLWEPDRPVVVVGRSSKIADEVNVQEVDRHNVPLIRRCSGGAAIVAAPGCLMYAVVLSYIRRPELRPLDVAHRFVLERIAQAIHQQIGPVYLAGTSDLAYGNRKISGNSMRCKRTHFLYHGTILYAMDLALISRLLGTAPRQPEYRRGRDHGEFVTNIAVDPHRLRSDLCNVWQVDGKLTHWPQIRTEDLVRRCYGQREWTFRW